MIPRTISPPTCMFYRRRLDVAAFPSTIRIIANRPNVTDDVRAVDTYERHTEGARRLLLCLGLVTTKTTGCVQSAYKDVL